MLLKYFHECGEALLHPFQPALGHSLEVDLILLG